MSEVLHFELAINRPDLIPPNTVKLLNSWSGSVPVEEILVAPIDPDFADSAAFCEKYNISPTEGVNCVVVEAIRGDKRTLAACLIPVNCRADLNKTARKALDARRVSFAPLDEVLQETGMEYGGITPLGLPAMYSILIDSRIMAKDRLIIGGGYRKSKLSIPSQAFIDLPNVLIIEGLGQEIINQ